jgi:hypothetical protein
LVGRLDHGLSRAGKIGPDVVDLAVSLGDGDVVQPVDEARNVLARGSES